MARDLLVAIALPHALRRDIALVATFILIEVRAQTGNGNLLTAPVNASAVSTAALFIPKSHTQNVKVNSGKYCNIVPCGSDGEYNTEFCCSTQDNQSCCSSTFGNVLGYPISLTATTANSSSNAVAEVPSNTTITTTTTTTTTPSPSPKASTAAVGAGVGVPLGVLLLLSLGFLAYRERKFRSYVKASEERYSSANVANVHEYKQEQYVPYELGDAPKLMPELESRKH